MIILDRFEKWIENNFDLSNPKILAKYDHTHSVYEIATQIVETEQFSNEDKFIAQTIAILHDCGRFIQIRDFDTFKDSKDFDHAVEGANLLENGLLEQILPETREYDCIIIPAVRYHNRLALPECDERQLMHCELIRDADRTDLYNVCLNHFDVTFWFNDNTSNLTPAVKQLFENRKPISFSVLQNQLDLLALRFSLLYQYKYVSALLYFKNNNYISRITELFSTKLPFYNQDDLNWIKLASEKVLDEYLNAH